MSKKQTIKVLLIDDDEDVFVLLKAFLANGDRFEYDISWSGVFENALKKMAHHNYDVILLDYYLGAKTGMELLDAAITQGCRSPFILLTNNTENNVDTQAIKKGAMDYLSKESFNQESLERSIEYAIERKSLMQKLQKERDQYAAISNDFGEFIRVVGYDVLPQVERIESKIQDIHAQKPSAEILTAAEDILGETKKISQLVKSFLELDLANS